MDHSIEYLDIVNDADEVIGTASKSEVYAKRLTHRIIHVLIFNEKNELALQLRSKDKSFLPNYWVTSAGGHVHSGEDYEQAAQREMKEELGIDLPLTFLYKDLYEDSVYQIGIKKILCTYKSTYNGLFEINQEVEKMEFFSLNTIQQMIKNDEKFHPELLFILQKHFAIQ